MNHALGEGSLAQPVDQQSSVLPLYHRRQKIERETDRDREREREREKEEKEERQRMRERRESQQCIHNTLTDSIPNLPNMLQIIHAVRESSGCTLTLTSLTGDLGMTIK